jgi:hypothetical protein
VRSLDEDSEVLEHQRISFTTISEKMPLVCLHEELPTGIGIVSFRYLSLFLANDLIRLFPSNLPVLIDSMWRQAAFPQTTRTCAGMKMKMI